MFAEDLALFFSTDEFAIAAQLGGVPVVGIFDDAYASVGDLATTGPAFLLPAASAAGVEGGVTQLALTHPGTQQATVYVVHGIEPDGTGAAALLLRKAA